MAQRISRAKQSIKSSGTAFRMPTDEERTARRRQQEVIDAETFRIIDEAVTASGVTP